MTTTLPALPTAAVELADGGWPVFPLRPHDKRPLRACHACWETKCPAPVECGHELCHGLLDATTDVPKVARWWAARPDANIGGRVPDWHIALDVDPRHGGDTALAELETRWGPLPPTLSVRTGSGGWHHYFQCRAQVTQSRLPRGVELRTPSNYCVMPPSIHPDTRRRYEWVRTEGIPQPLPGWLSELIRRPTQAPVPSSPSRVPTAVPDRGSVPDGARHHELVSLAGWLRAHGVDRDDALVIYRSRWEACAQPPAARWPISWEDATAKLDDIYARYAAGGGR